jgi:hypothetical protein
MHLVLSGLTLGPVLAASLALPAAAQPGALPQTYSFAGTNAMFGTPQNVKVNRNGSKELIERTRPAKPGRYGELHDKLLYDFQAHKIYSVSLTTNQCTVQEYGSAYAPMFDPVGGSQEMTAGLAGAPQGAMKRETVNGIATRVFEVPLPENQGKYKIWVEEKSNFLVKWVSALAGSTEETQVEIRDLSYAPSPAALFVAPEGCVHIGGVSLANGGHSEVTVEVNVPTQTADLATGKVTGAQPGASADAPGAGELLRAVPRESPTGRRDHHRRAGHGVVSLPGRRGEPLAGGDSDVRRRGHQDGHGGWSVQHGSAGAERVDAHFDAGRAGPSRSTEREFGTGTLSHRLHELGRSQANRTERSQESGAPLRN